MHVIEWKEKKSCFQITRNHRHTSTDDQTNRQTLRQPFASSEERIVQACSPDPSLATSCEPVAVVTKHYIRLFFKKWTLMTYFFAQSLLCRFVFRLFELFLAPDIQRFDDTLRLRTERLFRSEREKDTNPFETFDGFQGC